MSEFKHFRVERAGNGWIITALGKDEDEFDGSSQTRATYVEHTDELACKRIQNLMRGSTFAP